MEGVSSEAASLAGTLGLGKIIYMYDDNKITIEGTTDIAFTENVEEMCIRDRELQGILRFARVTKQSQSLRKLAALMNCAPNTTRKELLRVAHLLCGLKDL